MVTLRRSVFAVLAPLGLACVIAACSSSTQSFPDTDASSGCTGGTTTCGSICADTAKDRDNCGACGKACAAGEVCTQSKCALDCVGGTTKCATSCVDTKNDRANCGACGKACATGEVCSAGACTVDCAAPLTKCGGACVDLRYDPANCGACGVACGAGLLCSVPQPAPDGGVGDASSDASSSDASVSDASSSDASVSDASSSDAGSGPTCSLQCLGGSSQCGNGCVQLASDPNNCGTCGNACPAVANAVPVCSVNACRYVCNANFYDCNGNPADGCESATVCIDRVVAGFTGQLGPDYSADGFAQCVGYFDTSAAGEIPDNGWANLCKVANTSQVRIACGASSNSVRYVDLSRNVFNSPFVSYPENNLIVNANFGGYVNACYATGNDPNAGTAWIGGPSGCGETNTNLTINNSCTFEASNCFGQNIAGSRYLYAYVKK